MNAIAKAVFVLVFVTAAIRSASFAPAPDTPDGNQNVQPK